MGLAGAGAVLGINKLAETFGTYQLQPRTIEYGIEVMEWFTPFGSIYLKIHPLFSWETANNNLLLLFSTDNLGFTYIDDTFFVSDPMDRRNRNHSKDGTEEEFITEGGLEWDHPEQMMLLSGIGQDNPE